LNSRGGNDEAVVLNLRNLAAQSGSLERGQQAIYAILGELAAVRVDVEPADVAYLIGNNPVAFAISRGLESRIPTLVTLLNSIEPEELFSNLESASAFVMNDRLEDADAQQVLNQGARWDLYKHGLLDSPKRITAVGWTIRQRPNPHRFPAIFKPSLQFGGRPSKRRSDGQETDL
jgi:hypothetical protein